MIISQGKYSQFKSKFSSCSEIPEPFGKLSIRIKKYCFRSKMSPLNATVVGNHTIYQCGGENNFLINDTQYFGMGDAYICGYQQALYKSEGKRLTLLSSLYSLFAIVLMFGFVHANVGHDIPDIVG